MNALILCVALSFCSAFSLQACVQAGGPTNPGSTPNFAAPSSVKRIPIEIPITNQIYLQASINNSEPMWFFLDTGSTFTFLDADKAKELKIASQGNLTLETGQAHPIMMSFARGATLEISGVKVPLRELAVMPIKFDHAPQVVGIIGSDLFKRFVVEVDYAAKAIELFEPDSYRYDARGEILPVEIMEEIPHVVVHISRGRANSLPAKLLVDTGASQTLMLDALFIEKHKLLETTEGTVQIRAGGLGGGSLVRTVRARTVKIGGVTLDGPLIYFTPNRRSGGWRDGVIGNGLLGRFKMILDYARRRVILEPSERFQNPIDFDSFLFEVVRDGEVYKISDVARAGMAGEAGLQAGDTLLAVDGKLVLGLSIIQIERMFMLDGRDRILTVKRGTEVLELRIKNYRVA